MNSESITIENQTDSQEERLKSTIFTSEEYMGPDCSCNIEDTLKRKSAYITEVNVNTLAHTIQVTFDPQKISVKDIEELLGSCGYECSSVSSVHEGKTPAHPPKHKQMEYREHRERKGMDPAAHSPENKHMEHREHREHKGMDPSAHHRMMAKDMRNRFFITGILAIPVLLLSPTIQEWLGLTISEFPGNELILLVFSSIIAFYGGFPFYKGAQKSLKNRRADMMVLVTVAVLAGYLYSLGTTFLFEAPDFYWEISTLVVFLLFGHWMEMRAVSGASGALTELVKLVPAQANLMKGNEIIETPTDALKTGDIVLVKPGESIPVDGIIIEGQSAINEAMITGESVPVSKKLDDQVIGGTINGQGSLQIKVTKTGEDTTISQISRMVRDAQSSKPQSQQLADRAANYLTIIALGVGSLTFLFWYVLLGTDLVFALTLTITVIVIACPHALGLAIPTVTSIATNLAAKSGMLIKTGNTLEDARKIDTIVFDKTGTLTLGEFGVTDIVSTDDWEEPLLLTLAAALEKNSEHTIAQGIVKKAVEEGLSLPVATNFQSFTGKGAKALIDSQEVYIGNPRLMSEIQIDVNHFKETINSLSSKGKTVVLVAAGGKLKGIIALADIIRGESYRAVKSLQEMGLKVAMFTGDNQKVAQYVSEELGLDYYFAELLPGDKSTKVKELQDQGMSVAMVGDGINDAPALTQANIGIAIGAGTDVAVESADVVLIKNNPLDIASLIFLSQATTQKMKENLIWATGYNAFAIPLAAGVLAPFGIFLRPEVGALFMAASSIIVVINALLLRRQKL
ncbi:MAG: heavy metal translocating P-type ATPase [Candidatus Hodarchaeales archaeon]|jgi:Cu2+-exporting ATPase